MEDPNLRDQIDRIIRGTTRPTRLRRALRCLGCCSHERREFPFFLSSYVPVGFLHDCASRGSLTTVTCLLKYTKCHVDQTDRRKRTALHYSCTYDQPHIASLLIEYNGNINVLDNEKSTPLIKAAQCGNMLCLSVLLEHGANPHPKDVHGYNALHYAVFRGNIKMAEMLLTANADLEARTKRGFTPFLLAIHEEKEDMAAFLEEKGADVHAVVRRKCACLPKPKSRQKTLKTEGKKRDSETNEGSASASPPVPIHKPPRRKWFKTGGKKGDTGLKEGSASASLSVSPPAPVGQTFLDSSGKSENDATTRESSPSASPGVPPPPAPGETPPETGAKSDDAVTGEPSPSASPGVPPPPAPGETPPESGAKNPDGVLDEAVASAPAPGRAPEPPRPKFRSRIPRYRHFPVSQKYVPGNSEGSARFSKIPGPVVPGPPRKYKSSSNNEAGKTPVSYLRSSGQRIPGLSENVNSQPSPALDSGDTSYLTADGVLSTCDKLVLP